MKLYINSEHLNQPATDITVHFHETLTGYKYIKLLECKMYNSWYNITENNNKLVFSVSGKQFTKEIDPGNYSVETLAQAVGRVKMINFKRMPATGKTLLLLDDTAKVDFSNHKNFANILGFKNKLYTTSQISSKKANFLTVSEYVVHCDIIDTPTNYINGKRTDYLQILTLQDTKDIGDQVSYSYPNAIPVPIKHTSLNRIRIWITDQNGGSIDFHGYPISYQLELL